MEDDTLKDDAARCKVRRRRPREVTPELISVEPVGWHEHAEMNQGAVEFVDGCDHGTGQASGTFRDRAKHGLHIGRRLTDHAQDLAGRLLLLLRLNQLAVARLKLRHHLRQALLQVAYPS